MALRSGTGPLRLKGHILVLNYNPDLVPVSGLCCNDGLCLASWLRKGWGETLEGMRDRG